MELLLLRQLLSLFLLLVSLPTPLAVPAGRSTRGIMRPLFAMSSAPVYGCLQHCGVLVADVARAKEFYMNVFSWSDESHLRPTSLPYPGAFMGIAGQFQVHLMQLPSMDPTEGRPEHGGRDRHMAVTVNNIDVIRDRLMARQLPYTMSQSGRRALFCRDPDGNAYEFMEDKTLG